MNSDACLSYFDESVYIVEFPNANPFGVSQQYFYKKKQKKTKATIKL